MIIFSQEINTLEAADLTQGLWPSVWMAAATFLSLIIMFIVLSKFLYFPIKNLLETRQEKIKKQLDEAAKMNEHSFITSEKIKEEFQKTKIERDQIITTSKEEAENLKKEILEKAKEETQFLINEGKVNLEKETKEAWDKLRDEVALISIELAEKIIEKKIDEKTEKKLIKEFLDKIENEH